MPQFNFPNGDPTINQSQNKNTTANEKLQKAIERNRLRQAKRDGKLGQVASKTTARNNSAASSVAAQKKNYQQQEFYFNNNQSRMGMPKQPQQRASSTTTARMNSTGTARMNSAGTTRMNTAGTASTRVSVATPNSETQFVQPMRKKAAIKKSSLKYPVKKTSTTKRKQAKVSKARNEWLMKGAWVFLSLIILRLVFADRGVLDYFAMKDLVEHKLNLIEESKVENKKLVDEMEMIKNNSRYQKKIVREKLGFISKDEYLVIFSGDSGLSSK